MRPLVGLDFPPYVAYADLRDPYDSFRYHFRLGGSGMVAAFQTPVVCESVKTNVVFLSEARRFFNGDRI